MKVPAAFLPGSTGFRVPRDCARGVGWSGAALRFHRVPQEFCKGSKKAPQCSTKGSRNFLQGSVVCPGGKQGVVRPSSEKLLD